MATNPTNIAGQVQQSLQADYYQMEGWETLSDDVSGSGNLNYQEVELKIDKDLLTFGGDLGGDYDAEPAVMRMRGIDEASYVSYDDVQSAGAFAGGAQYVPTAETQGLGDLESALQSLGVAPLAELAGDSLTLVSNDAAPTGSGGGGGSSVTLNNSDSNSTTTTTTVVTEDDGCCCTGGGVTVNVTTATVNNTFLDIDITDITSVTQVLGGLDITLITNIGLGDVINNYGGINIDLSGGGINIDIDNTLTVIGGDIITNIDLGLGDGLHLDIDLGIEGLPIVGDLLAELTHIGLDLGDGGLSVETDLIGGDLLGGLITLNEDGLGVDLGVGVPAFFGGDALGLLDLDLDLGDGLGLGADLLGQDLLDLDVLGSDGLNLDVLGQDLLNDPNALAGVIDGVVGQDGLLAGVLGGDLLNGGLLDVQLGGDGFADVDLLGNDLVGDGGLLAEVVGDGGVLDNIPHEILDVNLLSDGEVLGVDVLGQDLLGGDILGDLAGGDLPDLGGGDLLDIELGGDGGLLDVDLLGGDLIGDGGLLGEVVGDGGALDVIPHEILDVNVLADGEVLGVDVLGVDAIDGVSDVAEDIFAGDAGDAIIGAVDDLLGDDLLGDALEDAADDLLGDGRDGVGEAVEAVGDALGGDLLGDLGAPVGDILPDAPAIPVLPNIFGGWHH